MLNNIIICLIFIIYGAGVLHAEQENTVSKLSLKDCYNYTLERSESLKIREEQILTSEKIYQETLATIFPTLDAGFEYRRRDNANFGRVQSGRIISVDDPSTPIGGSGGILGKTQAGGLVSLNQPLFRGFREYLLLNAAEIETKARKLDFLRNKEILYLNVADIYYQINAAENELDVLREAKKTLQERTKELNNFISLGKSRESEVVAAAADIANLESNIIQINGLKRASLELLSFLTGLPSDKLNLQNVQSRPKLNPLDDYLDKSEVRSDVLAAKNRLEAQNHLTEAVSRENWPVLDLLGTGYSLQDPDRNQAWEMVVRFSVPIFDGGRNNSRIAQQESQKRILSLGLQQQKRAVERDIKVAFANTTSALEELTSLKMLKETAEKNYGLQKTDYENGVVTNLEVLQAIQQSQDIKRRIVRAKQTFLTRYAELLINSGGVPE